MWRYFALLLLHAPNEQHEYMVSIWQWSPSHQIWRGIGYWLFNLGYFPCGMGVVDSIFPQSYTWFCQLHAGWTSRSTHLTSLSDLRFYWLVIQSRCLLMWKNSLIAELVKKRVLLDLIGSLLGKLCGRIQLCPLGIMWLLQLMEIDGSCQTKVSVPVNTELRFQSPTTRHNYVLSKCQLGNQSKKKHEGLETSEGKWACFNL